jgi:two-component system, NarL family, nitrate/nitrite response regulator NarL
MRVVVCDDHHLLVQALATALGDVGYTVEAAVTSPQDGVRAVALLDPDVLLIDVSFPSGSGLDAAREVVAKHPGTKVVMLTGGDAAEPLREALEIGVAGYLRKVQRIEAIASALERVVAGETVIDGQLLNRAGNGNGSGPRRTAVDDLTPQEVRVLQLLAEGCSTNDMMRRLDVTASTVRTHVQSIFVKLGVHSRLQAVALVSRDGLVDRMDGFRRDAG